MARFLHDPQCLRVSLTLLPAGHAACKSQAFMRSTACLSLSAMLLLFSSACAGRVTGSSPGSGGPDSPGGDDGAGDDEPGPRAATYYRDVLPVVQARCAGCHTEGGAAFALDTYEAAAPMASAMALATADHRMPPWPPGRSCGSFEGEDGRRITDDQVAVFRAWMEAGSPAGDPADAPAAPAPAPGLGAPDLTLDPGADYVFDGLQEDRYWCFRLPGTIAAGTDVVAMDIEPGNKEIVHHVIVFKEPNGAAKERGLPGFQCDGVPPNTDFLFGWVPGSRPAQFPPGMGMRLEPTDALVMQVHYHAHSATSATDRTRFELYTADQPVSEHLRVVWTGSIDINVPAGQSATASGDCTLPAGAAPVKIVSVAPHMHQTATTFQSKIQRAGGGEECLIDIPSWDFEWQGGYQYKQPILLNPGDTIRTTCTYKNTTPQPVSFGESTSDEMCFQFNFVVDDGTLPEKCFAPCTFLPCDNLGF